MNKERKAVMAYLREQMIPDPVDDAEEHFNYCLSAMIVSIGKGEHFPTGEGE